MMNLNLIINISGFKNTYVQINIEESTKVCEIYNKMVETVIEKMKKDREI